jgi:C4-dicarboxylate-specific signal transduction histidine kinase
VGASVALAGLIDLVADLESAGVSVAVHDSSPWFGAKELQRAFEPFYPTKSQGMDMGLAISRSIVESLTFVGEGQRATRPQLELQGQP